MKCTKCGAEITEDVKFCTECGAPLESESETTKETSETDAQTEAQAAPSDLKTPEAEPQSNKKFTKILIAALAVVAVIGIGALAYAKLVAKSPKQVVIDAFENIYTEDQTNPIEELFGASEFAKAAGSTDNENGFTLKLDSCSDETVNAFAGSGVRMALRSDVANSKADFNLGAIYNGMDLANMNMYYGDKTLMASVPELSGKVYTLDLSEGLAERLKNSPTLAPVIEENGIDVDGLASYLTQLIDETEQEAKDGKTTFDVKALADRYKEGCKAQDNFKAAMAVEKADKASYTMDGKEVSCTGYNVTVSKDAMIEFLRTSSDFFLQDETLKQDFLKQLETTVRISEIMGGSAAGVPSSAADMQQQSYDEAQQNVDEIITYLDKALTDVSMTVYVTKDGRLAAVDGTTAINAEAEEGAENDGPTEVAFKVELQGGSYLTQNVTANITMTQAEDTLALDIIKQGTYDGKQLTGDISFMFSATGADGSNDEISAVYTSTYNSDGGDYHVALDVASAGSQLVDISAIGAIDQLEKGKSMHINIDALEASAMDHAVSATLSGEYYYQPLSGEITPLEGESMDVLAATQDEWNAAMMEMMFGAIGLSGQIQMPGN